MRVQHLFDLSGRVALVTGGSRGLGKEIAEGLGEAGAQVVIAARREQWLRPAEEELRAAGIACLAVGFDIPRPDQVGACVRAAVDRFGGIDILVNNAGISWGAPAVEMPLEKWRQVLESNLTGAVLGRNQRLVEESTPLGRIGRPGEIKGVAVFLAAAASDYITGQVIAVDGGRSAL